MLSWRLEIWYKWCFDHEDQELTWGISKVLTFGFYANMVTSNTSIPINKGENSRTLFACIQKTEVTRGKNS